MRLLLLVFTGLAASPMVAQDEPVLPIVIATCLEKSRVRDSVVVDRNSNPYYLRGDFDGDGKPDHAVAVKGSKSQRNGVLICAGSGKVTLLGGDNPVRPPFSDLPNDNFVAPNWEVATRADVLSLRTTNKIVPEPKGESIMMIWEDGIHYIYWDGNRYRWSPVMQ